MLAVDPSDARPLWSQIQEGLHVLVASGHLPPGAPVPSVRELARQLHVNPATAAKAYRRLVAGGVLAVRRGEGTFVADRPAELPARHVAERIAAAASQFVTRSRQLGVSRADAGEAFGKAWEELEPQDERSST